MPKQERDPIRSVYKKPKTTKRPNGLLAKARKFLEFKELKEFKERFRNRQELANGAADDPDQMTLRESLKEDGLMAKAVSVLLFVFLWVAILLSMMPLVGWWGGVCGLLFLAFQFGWKYIKHTGSARFYTPARKKALRLALWAVLFGIVAQGSCMIHSERLISQFNREAAQEKAVIFKASFKDSGAHADK